MSELLTILIYLLIAGVVIYVVQLVLGMLALPAPVKTIALLIVAIVFLVWILRAFGFLVF